MFLLQLIAAASELPSSLGLTRRHGMLQLSARLTSFFNLREERGRGCFYARSIAFLMSESTISLLIFIVAEDVDELCFTS